MPDSTWPPTIDTFASPLATDQVGPASAGKDHALLDRQAAHVLQELEARAQLGKEFYSIIQTKSTYASGTVAVNRRTGEQEFGPGAFHTVFNSVSSALQGLAVPGGIVSIRTTKADNTSIKTRDFLQGWDGMVLRGFGYAKVGQGSQGHPDAGVTIEAESNQFPAGRKAVLDVSTGSGPLDNWVLDGVSIEANNEAECAVRAAVTQQGKGSIFRLNLRGGTGDTLRLGETGWTGCGRVQMFHAQVSHNGTGAASLVGVYAGDFESLYNNVALNAGSAIAYLLNTPGDVDVITGHDGGGGSHWPGVKIVQCRHARFAVQYHDNQADRVHGAYWIVPSSNGAVGIVDIMHGRINQNDDGTGVGPWVYLDGSNANRGAKLVRIHQIISAGAQLVGGTPPNAIAQVYAVRQWDPGSIVVIESNYGFLLSNVWATDGSTAWTPAFLDGNQRTVTRSVSGSVLGDQILKVQMSGTSQAFAHKCYAVPDWARVTPRGNNAPAGRLSAEVTASQVIVHSSATETNLPLNIRLKVLGS